MARTAVELGHEYLALTDHSPRLTVAHGLTAERLREQLDDRRQAERGARAVPHPHRHRGRHPRATAPSTRTTSCSPSSTSWSRACTPKLKMEERAMTARMIGAIANPHMDILGHCTGRLVKGRGRKESTFDAELVFAACRRARQGGRGQLPTRAARPAASAARDGRRDGLSRSRSTPTRTRPVSSPGTRYGCARVAETDIDRIADRQLLAHRRPPGLDRRPTRPRSRPPLGLCETRSL